MALSYRDAVRTTPDLVAYWRLGESSGTAVDLASTHDGTATGVTQGEPGLISADSDTAYGFGGSGEVVIPDHTDFEGASGLTIEAWIKPDSGTWSTGASVFNRRTPGNTLGYSLQQHTSGGYNWYIAVSGSIHGQTTFGWSTSSAEHIATTYDGATMRTYRNGVGVGTPVSIAGTITDPPSPAVKIGRAIDNGTSFAGVIDDVAVYTRALTDTEIADHYAARLVAPPPLPVDPPSATPPVITASTDSGTGGGITVWWELWRATLDNVLVEDISDHLTGGGITLNHDRAFTTEARFNLQDVGVVTPPTDYLAIFQHQQYDDGRPDTRSQLGLFTTTVPPGIRTIERSDGTYTGLDLTSVLARYAFDDTYNIAASTNVITAVTTLLGLAGITRHTIPASADVLPNAKSFAIGTTYLDAANQLLSSIGYYHLSMSTDGRLVSGESREAQYVEPWRTITDADVMGPIENQPTNSGIHNIVIVVNDNMIDPPLTAVRRNDDLTSPTSTVNIGPRVRPTEYRSDLADQAAVDALADRLLAEERSFYQTARLLLLPDPSALDTHQVVDLALTGKQQILSGRWRVRTVRMGFDPDSAGPEIEINRVTSSIEGSLI